MNTEEAREMLEGGPSRPAGHVADVPEGRGEYAFGSPWSGVAKLAEECGEVVTVVAKLMATGGDPAHWQGDLTEKLADEMGDVLGAIRHVIGFTAVDADRLYERARVKEALFAARITGAGETHGYPPLPVEHCCGREGGSLWTRLSGLLTSGFVIMRRTIVGITSRSAAARLSAGPAGWST